MNLKVALVVIALVLSSVAAGYYVFVQQIPSDLELTSWDIKGAWWITQDWLGWRNQDNNYQKYATFYDGESIKGCDYTLTYKQNNGYGDPTNWKVTVEVQDKDHNAIRTSTTSGGALTVGQTVTAVCNFNNLVLSHDIRYHGDVWIEIYNPAVGWEGGQCVWNLPVNVQPDYPNLVLTSYTLDKTSVQEGDAVSATFSIMNDGRAAGVLRYGLYPDIDDRNQWMGSSEPTYSYDLTGVNIAVGQTISYTKQFTVHSTNVQYTDGDIHVGLDAWANPSEMHDERILDFVTINPPKNPPNLPSNPTPANGAPSVDYSSVTLKWSCTDPDGDSLTYNVYFGTSPTPPIKTQGITDMQYTVGPVGDGTAYYWQIYAFDGELGKYGPVWTFSTGSANHPPNIPTNPDPVNGETDVPDGAITLYWDGSDPDGNIVTYDIYFGTDAVPSTLVRTQQSTHWKTPDLESSTNYYWKINAKDTNDVYSYGPTWCFTTESEITPPPSNDPPEIIDDSGNLNLKAGEIVTLWVNANDDKGVTSVLIEVDGESLGEMSYDLLQMRWEYTFIAPESGVSQTTYSVTVYDEGGLSDSISRYIFIDFSQHSNLIDQLEQIVMEYWQYILVGLGILLVIVLVLRRR
jgi:hypothetical protein